MSSHGPKKKLRPRRKRHCAPVTAIRTREQRDRDLLAVADILTCGRALSHQAIADEFNASDRPYKISRRQISEDIAEVYEMWHVELAKDVDKLRARELVRLDRLERKAWECMEASCQPGERTQQTIAKLKDGVQTSRITKSTVTRTGNPEWMALIIKCSEQRSRLLGLYKQPEGLKDAGTASDGSGPAPFALQIVFEGSEAESKDALNFPVIDAQTSDATSIPEGAAPVGPTMVVR
jgi:hypothetical protein